MGSAETAIHSLIRRASSVYTAGPAVQDASDACERLAHEGIPTTTCYWDINADHERVVSRNYLGLLGAIAGSASDCYLSVKAPALKFDTQLARKILEEARRLNAIVHFDAMAPETADRTFALIAEAREIYPRLGCTLPSRWRRSLEDADRAVESRLRIRIVKGRWGGGTGDDPDPREGFLSIVDRLAGRAVHVAVATHNPAVARQSLRRLKDAGTPCELELLYGLPDRAMLVIARNFGVRARMYVPCGHAGLPYRVKDALREPRILGWFIRDLIRGWGKN
jgi:proline dehydrogenase